MIIRAINFAKISCPYSSSFVIRLSSFVSRHSSLVSRHSSFISRLSSLIIRHSSLVSRLSSFVSRHSSLVIRLSSLKKASIPSRLGDAPLFALYFCPRILKVLRNENLFEHRPFFSASARSTRTRYYPNT